jgi:hypothetical protein
MEFHIHFISAIFVFLPEASSEVGNQLPDKCEEGIIVGVLSNLQVPVHKGAEVTGEELGEDIIGEELLKVQAILQKEADKLGSVFYECCEHNFLKVSRLRRKSRKKNHILSPIEKIQGDLFSQKRCSFHQRVMLSSASLSILFENKIYVSVLAQHWIIVQTSNGEAAWWGL